MGYDAHITRRRAWSDADGPHITEQEFRALMQGDAELASLYWDDGNICAKNPDPALLRKMVSVAGTLAATVQGDDGEFYDGEGNATPARQSPLFTRIASWVRNLVSSGPEPIDPSSLPFKVGDRVYVLGHFGRVTDIDVRANHGLGRITVKYEDGSTSFFAAVAHGCERADA